MLLCPKLPKRRFWANKFCVRGTSIGAHYREANRAKSDADFISKMETGLQELDETVYWLELIIESGIFNEKMTAPIITETNELNAIFTTIVKKVKAKKS